MTQEPPAPATPEDLFARLDALGIAVRTRRHRPVFTVDESRDLRGEIPGAHAKSLFLRDKKGAMWLVVALENRRIELKALQDLLGAGRLSFGSPERLMTHLGVTPGAVTPFAAINDRDHQVAIVLDAALMAAESANFHPLVNDATTTIAPADLVRFLEACGHDPTVLDLAPATAG